MHFFGLNYFLFGMILWDGENLIGRFCWPKQNLSNGMMARGRTFGALRREWLRWRWTGEHICVTPQFISNPVNFILPHYANQRNIPSSPCRDFLCERSSVLNLHRQTTLNNKLYPLISNGIDIAYDALLVLFYFNPESILSLKYHLHLSSKKESGKSHGFKDDFNDTYTLDEYYIYTYYYPAEGRGGGNARPKKSQNNCAGNCREHLRIFAIKSGCMLYPSA